MSTMVRFEFAEGSLSIDLDTIPLVGDSVTMEVWDQEKWVSVPAEGVVAQRTWTQEKSTVGYGVGNGPAHFPLVPVCVLRIEGTEAAP